MKASVAVDIALALLENAAKISMIARGAQGANRDMLTNEEWKKVQEIDERARKRLQDAIAAVEG